MDRETELDAIAKMRGSGVILARLRWFEDTIAWVGRCDRREIARRFGVSKAQASSDIALYMKVAPDNLVLLPDRRFYAPASSFVPLFPKDPRAFIETEQATPHGFALPVERLHDPWRCVRPDVVASLTSSAVNRVPLSIVMPGGAGAGFCPFRLIDDGRRLLVQGWNIEESAIRVYDVEEIVEAAPTRAGMWVGPAPGQVQRYSAADCPAAAAA